LISDSPALACGAVVVHFQAQQFYRESVLWITLLLLLLDYEVVWLGEIFAGMY
jgi:hypothetical protein